MDEKALVSDVLTYNNGIQFLNISAGSWGSDNCAAYLDEKGLFNTVAMVLVVRHHDAAESRI